jgi:O-antigen/teichoic acid export membrane protein
MKKQLAKITQSEFAINSIKLLSGTTIAQAISIVTAPLLYRIFDKDDYGTLGLYMAIVGLVGVFSTMQFNQAILLEKEDDDAKVLMWLIRLINIGVAFIALIIVFFFRETIAVSLGNEKVAPWLYLTPISIFFSGQGQIFSVWANRKKKYKILAFNAILTALLVPVVSISIGVFNNGPFGLFMGLVVSQTLPSIVLLIMLTRKEDLGWNYFNMKKNIGLVRKYKKFPIYSVPATFVSDFSHNLPVLMFSKYFGSEIVAFYSLSNRMLGLPSNLISNAIGQVYNQKITTLYNQTGSIKRFYFKTLKTLIILSIVLFGFAALLIPKAFPILFGAEWNQAIPISQIMIIIFVLRFINSPLSFIIYIKEKQQIDLIASLYFVLSTIVCFWFVNQFDLGYLQATWVYVLNFCSIYLVIMFYNHKLSIS